MDDPFDLTAAFLLGLLGLGLPLLGWSFAVLDYRAYLRSLRQMLAVLPAHSTKRRDTPAWAEQKDHQQPECLEALGLCLPATTDQVMAAYRQKVKLVHPDRGGSPTEFQALQGHLEEALRLVKQLEVQATSIQTDQTS